MHCSSLASSSSHEQYQQQNHVCSGRDYLCLFSTPTLKARRVDAGSMRPTMMPRRGTVSKSAASASSPAMKASTSAGQIPITKFVTCYRAIFTGTTKPEPYTDKDPERFYFDLFCLNVDKSALSGLVEALPDSALIESGSIKVRMLHKPSYSS